RMGPVVPPIETMVRVGLAGRGCEHAKGGCADRDRDLSLEDHSSVNRLGMMVSRRQVAAAPEGGLTGRRARSTRHRDPAGWRFGSERTKSAVPLTMQSTNMTDMIAKVVGAAESCTREGPAVAKASRVM